MDPAEESLTVLLPPPRPLLLKEPPSHFDPPDSSHRPWYAPYFHQSQHCFISARSFIYQYQTL